MIFKNAPENPINRMICVVVACLFFVVIFLVLLSFFRDTGLVFNRFKPERFESRLAAAGPDINEAQLRADHEIESDQAEEKTSVVEWLMSFLGGVGATVLAGMLRAFDFLSNGIERILERGPPEPENPDASPEVKPVAVQSDAEAKECKSQILNEQWTRGMEWLKACRDGDAALVIKMCQAAAGDSNFLMPKPEESKEE